MLNNDDDFRAAWDYISSWYVGLRYVHTGNGIKNTASSCIDSLGGVLPWIEKQLYN